MRARGTGCVYQPKGVKVWWVSYWVGKKQYQESSGSRVKQGAVDLLKQRMVEHATGQYVERGPKAVTFDDLAQRIEDDYTANGRRSLGGVLNSIEHLREAFGGKPAADITAAALTRYVADRRSGKPVAAAATIRKELMAVSKMLTLWRFPGKKKAVHAEIPSIDASGNVRKGFFEEKELRAVLTHLEPEYRPAVEFAYLTGWRRGEVLGLTWRQVDFEAGTVRLEPGTTKNDEGRTFPFAVLPPLADLLRRQREYTERVQRERGCVIAAVFHRNGEPIRDFHDAWERARKAAGLPGRLIHDLRRTAARNLRRIGMSESDIMELCGWETRSMFQRYTIKDDAGLAERLAKAVAGSSTPSARSVWVQLRSRGSEPSEERSGDA